MPQEQESEKSTTTWCCQADCIYPTSSRPPAPSTTDHNHEPAKLALLPSKCVLNGSDVADWVLVAPHTENGMVSEISSQIIFSQCVISFCSSCWKLFFDLGCVKNSLNTGHLRCLSGLVCTSESDNGAGLDCSLPIMAQFSDQPGLSVHLLWLMQEMSKKNTPSFLLWCLLHEPQQMHTQFKLSAGSPCCDRQAPVKIGVIIRLTGVYQARKALQMPYI